MLNYYNSDNKVVITMAQMMVMRKTLDEKARKKALDAIFNRFDFNQNGGPQRFVLLYIKINF